MATVSRLLLSGSTSGRPTKVAATSTPGTLIHTALSGPVGFDEVWLWVTNTNAGAVNLTVEWGGVTSPDDLVTEAVSIPADSGPTLIVPGLVLNNGLLVRAFASMTNVLLITGYVNRIQ